MLHQNLQFGKTKNLILHAWIPKFNSGCYIASKHTGSVQYVTNHSILQQSKHDCGSPGNETMTQTDF